MTRPKVSPEKRQRTAQACESCKRRKQKCDGLQPCQTCLKRGLACTYGPLGPTDSAYDDYASTSSMSKRRHIEDFTPPTAGPSPPYQNHAATFQSGHSELIELHDVSSHLNPVHQFTGPVYVPPKTVNDSTSPSSPLHSRLASAYHSPMGENAEEEAEVHMEPRMLRDDTDRLLYIGDSATLSFLQLVRKIVETSGGPSPFTNDPSRHRIVENTGSYVGMQTQSRHELMPDKNTCQVLLNAFFTETSGLVEVVNQRTFLATFEAYYANPLSADGNWLCHLFLMFAVGLVLASPVPGSATEAVFMQLKASKSHRGTSESSNYVLDRAASFYKTARDSCKDPYAPFEDSDFWSVQALTLMVIYNLAVNKRSAAYACHGMAVRSAFSLGLHREETMIVFNTEERNVRRNLWRSLFILDRYLAASLGRPTAISEEDCSGDTLNTDVADMYSAIDGVQTKPHGTLGLEAAVRSARVIGTIMKKVYAKRKISAKLAQRIADECKSWTQKLDASLHWRAVNSKSAYETGCGVTILHVNLLYCHSIILLTRPFFLHLLHRYQKDKVMNDGKRSKRFGMKMEKFSEACVTASCHSVVLVQNAWDRGCLSRRNPFTSQFLFAATLVILSNEFAKLYDSPSAGSCIQNAINIFAYCSEGEFGDPLAGRLLFILKAFRDVVDAQQESQRIRHISNSFEDPITNLFPSNNNDVLPPIYMNTSVTEGSREYGIAPTIDSIIGTARTSELRMPVPTFDVTQLVDVTNDDHRGRSQSFSSPSTMQPPHIMKQSLLPMFSPDTAKEESTDGDSLGGDAEIDFDAFWHMPVGGVNLGAGLEGNMLSDGAHYDFNSVQEISDSRVPLYAVAGFGE